MHDVRKVALGVGASLTLTGATPALAETGQPDKWEGAPTEEFRQPEELPGYHLKVSPTVGRQLGDSTLKLYRTYKAPEEGKPDSSDVTAYNAGCTVLRLRIGKNTFGSLAGHCFNYETGNEMGTLNGSSFFPRASAFDFFRRAAGQYFVTDPKEYVQKRQPLAAAYGISINTQGIDWALLKLAPVTEPDPKQGVPKRSYRQISSITLPSRAPKLIPGREVAISGLPGSNLDRPISKAHSIGRYLGRIIKSDYDPKTQATNTRELDIVGIKPQQPWEDSCDYGASGGHFAWSTEAQPDKAFTSGPLTLRFNSKYDPYLHSDSTAPNQKAAIKSRLLYQESMRSFIEYQLKVKTDEFTTLCAYTPYSTTTRLAVKNTVKAFGHYVEAFPTLPNKGGGKG